jgi:penicillin-binding protein 1A
MEDVVKIGTGTRTRFQSINMPVAGKTGTTSSDLDLWFVGYTPYYTAGIWGGYDNNKDQVETSYHKIIWRTIMEQIHIKAKKETKEFERPDSIVSRKICTKSGKLAVEGLCDHALGGSTVRTEYFEKGTEPTEPCDSHVKYKVCKASGKLAGEFCPEDEVEEKVYLIKKETGKTADTKNILPKNLEDSICNVHTEFPIETVPPIDNTIPTPPANQTSPTPQFPDPTPTIPPVNEANIPGKSTKINKPKN